MLAKSLYLEETAENINREPEDIGPERSCATFLIFLSSNSTSPEALIQV